jgi:hypothetical protein
MSPVVRYLLWFILGSLPGLVFGRPVLDGPTDAVGGPDWSDASYWDRERLAEEKTRYSAALHLAGFTAYETRGREAEVRDRGSFWQLAIWAGLTLIGGLVVAGLWLWVRAEQGVGDLFRMLLMSFLFLVAVAMIPKFMLARPTETSEQADHDHLLVFPFLVASFLVPVYLMSIVTLLAERQSLAAWLVRGVCRLVLGVYFLGAMLGLVGVFAIKILSGK